MSGDQGAISTAPPLPPASSGWPDGHAPARLPAHEIRRYRVLVNWRGQVAAAVGGVGFLIVRGVLLWIVVPDVVEANASAACPLLKNRRMSAVTHRISAFDPA